MNLDFAAGCGAKIARGNDFAPLDEDNGVTGDFDFTQEMGVEEDGGAALAFIADDVADEVAAHGVEARSGLIEEDEFRLVNEGLGKADALHHAFGEATETAIAMRRETNEIDIGRNAIAKLRRRQSGETAVEGEEFGRSQPVVETKIFGEEADFAADFDIGIRVTEDLRLAAGGLDEAEKHFDGGAFAGAVGAKEAKNFAATDLERKTANRDL